MRNFSRRILLAVTGVSPQIVTETLYALGQPAGSAQPSFIPTEVRLVTTQTGKRHAVEHLLDKGQLNALLHDYPQLGNPLFDESHIHVICDDEGRPLDDISSEAENIQAANTITQLMAQLTRDEDSALHVSLSGGRKTMGFYVGYAFSLFARPQDELSHVLVSSPFESEAQFFYPPAQPRMLTTRTGAQANTADARITLASIPVVRLRHGLPEQLQAGQASYSDTVEAIQTSFAPPHLRVDLRQKQIICGGQPVRLPDALFVWMAWWAQQTSQGQTQSWRSFSDEATLSEDLLKIYKRLPGHKAGNYERLAERIQGNNHELDDKKREILEESRQNFFQENNAKLKKSLEKQLGITTALHYIPHSYGKRPHTNHRLPLEPTQIELAGFPD